MSDQTTQFWKNFSHKDFNQAQQFFDQLSDTDKQTVLAELFQKSEFHRRPVMVSVLRRELHNNKSFDDFYQAWLPTQEMQRFPVPVRVINATNMNNPKEVFSIGLTWVANKEEEQGLWDYVKKATRGEDKDNETRHDRIKKVADGGLLGLFKVKTDDNLGQPF